MTNLTRRAFLAGAATVAAIVGLPAVVSHALPGRAIAADQVMKTIHITRGHFTVLEVHRYLMELFDDTDWIDLDIPSVRITDEFIRLENGWTIDVKSFERISSGTIEQGDQLWSSISCHPAGEAGPSDYQMLCTKWF